MPGAMERQSTLPRDLAALRQGNLEANQALLGNTISIPDQAWQQLSALPGWTRAHVATHLARGAEALRGVIRAVVQGTPTALYDSEAERFEAIERGSERDALELQIDLDTTASRLAQEMALLDDLDPAMPIELDAGRLVRLDLLPLARLNEIILHHLDLCWDYDIGKVEPQVAEWLLAWNAYWIAEREGYPPIELIADSGFQARIGSAAPPARISGPDNVMLGWLTGRLPEEEVREAGLPVLPSYG